MSCRLVGSPVTIEYFPLKPGNKALVDQLWALYLKNGRRHGFHVLSRADFYRIHLGGTPGLTLMLARVSCCGDGRGQGTHCAGYKGYKSVGRRRCADKLVTCMQPGNA